MSNTASVPRLRTLAAALSIALAGGGAALDTHSALAAATSGGWAAKLKNLQPHNRAHHTNVVRSGFAAAVSRVVQSLPHVAPPARAPMTRVVSSVVDAGSGSLREALSTAVDGDVIDLSGLHGRIALSGALVPSASVSIKGPGRDELILDGGGVDRVIASVHSLTLSNVTIANGMATTSPVGGCLFVYDGELSLTNATITGCTAVQQSGEPPEAVGGAIFNLGSLYIKYSTVSNSSATAQYAIGGGIAAISKYTSGGPVQGPAIIGSNITGNSASGIAYAGGGGIFTAYYQETTGNSVTAYFVGSTISGNTAQSTGYYDASNQVENSYAQGGGAVFAKYVTPAVGYSTISGNAAKATITGAYANVGGAAYGGGIYAYGGTTALTVTRSIMTGNTAYSAAGPAFGGGTMAVYGDLQVTGSTVSGNSASGAGPYVSWGGGIFGHYNLTLAGSTLSNNSVGGSYAGFGGGAAVYNTTPATATLTIQNATISGNTAGGAGFGVGGGVYVTSSGGIAAYNSTIAFNSATYAGGVNMNPYTAAATNPIVSTIIANNVVTGGLPTTADLSSPSSTPIVIGGSNDIIMTIYGVTVPGDTNPADPLLLPLAFNGGSTQTHALDPASPAVDSGLNPLTLTTDQRGDGYPREVPTGSPDIGAYELDTDHIFGNGFD